MGIMSLYVRRRRKVHAFVLSFWRKVFLRFSHWTPSSPGIWIRAVIARSRTSTSPVRPSARLANLGASSSWTTATRITPTQCASTNATSTTSNTTVSGKLLSWQKLYEHDSLINMAMRLQCLLLASVHTSYSNVISSASDLKRPLAFGPKLNTSHC